MEIGKHGDSLSKWHIENRVRRKVAKLFLAHVFNKWYEMKGLKAPEPYAFAMLGHDGTTTKIAIGEMETKAKLRAKRNVKEPHGMNASHAGGVTHY